MAASGLVAQYKELLGNASTILFDKNKREPLLCYCC